MKYAKFALILLSLFAGGLLFAKVEFFDAPRENSVKVFNGKNANLNLDEKTAVKIAEAVLSLIYGEQTIIADCTARKE